MANFDKGDLVRCTGTFTDIAGAVTDPTAVYFQVTNPAGTKVSYVYGTDAALVKSSSGIYYVDVDAASAGRWYYRFYSTGTGQAADEQLFDVDETIN